MEYTSSQMVVLRLYASNSDWMTVSSVREHAGLSASAARSALTQLEKRGLLTSRFVMYDDGKVKTWEPTSNGWRVINELPSA